MLGTALKARHLGRYKSIARLLIKYGRSDLLSKAGLEEGEPADVAAEFEGDPEAFARDLERLGPTFVKLGQLLSTRSDLIPERYLEALSRLQDKVEPFPFSEVERTIEEELGAKLGKLFASFDPVPKAAASLGQLHRARLRGGRDVAVKVQRPGVRRTLIEDLQVVAEAAAFLDWHTELGRRYEFGRTARELRKNLLRELDYNEEARNLLELGENLEEFERIVVPRPHLDFTTSRVLTMDFVSGRKITGLTPLALTELDAPGLADELFRCYLKQVLVDGFFHADPHPGNVLLTDGGRLALLDLGMAARLAPDLQEDLFSLLLAVVDARAQAAADVAIRAGAPRDDFDEEEFRDRIARLVLHRKDPTVSQLDTGRIILEIARAAAACGLRLPGELTMLGKALLNLDRAVWTLDPEYDPSAAVRGDAPTLMRRRLRQSLSLGSAIAAGLDLKRFAESLPARLGRIMDVVGGNELRIRLELFDEQELIAGMQKIANRIAMGVLLGSLTIGAAFIMRIETPFRLFGYPGLAILFFLAAAGGAVALMVDILYYDARARRGPRRR